MDIRPARRSGLGSEVTTSLRQAIFDGVFKSGSRLGEIEIAQQLDVSRGPVREALLQLRAEGLVSMELHRGASVVTLSVEDIGELTTLRITLERFAVALALATPDEAHFAAMDAVIADMEVAVAAADISRLSQLDIAFHDAVYGAAAHTRLTAAWQTIRSQMLLFLLTRGEANRDYLAIAVDEHRELVAILRSGDVALAQRTIESHVRGAYDRLVASLSVDAG
jgi:DNA-binding GntR family transcriptional regulator